MNDREKLIDLFNSFYGVDPMYYGVEADSLADHLLANGVTVQRWIPVTERLPEETKKVMAFVNGVRITAVLKGGVWLSSWNHDVVNDEVTHWMPLPEPPKEDAE